MNSKVLKDNWHIKNVDWPWSSFKWENYRTYVWANVMHLKNFFSDKHFHLYVKYWLAKAIITWENIDVWKQLYIKMQKKRIWEAKFWKFDQLIDSIVWKWYNWSVIPVDNDFNILDWSHRLWILAVLWIHPTIEILSFPSHNYDINWFYNNWFTNEEIDLIKSAKKDFFQKYIWSLQSKKVWFIWWSTINDLWWKWDKIISLIWVDNLSDFYIRNFWNQLSNLIDIAYYWDWIDSSTLRKKNLWISERSKWLLWVISFTWNDNWNIKQIKERVREWIIPELSEYLFDSIIHSVDEAHPQSNKIRLQIDDIVAKMNALLYI